MYFNYLDMKVSLAKPWIYAVYLQAEYA